MDIIYRKHEYVHRMIYSLTLDPADLTHVPIAVRATSILRSAFAPKNLFIAHVTAIVVLPVSYGSS
jgi:hypothetical protein